MPWLPRRLVFNTLSTVGWLPHLRAPSFRCVRMCSRVAVFDYSFAVATFWNCWMKLPIFAFTCEIGCFEDFQMYCAWLSIWVLLYRISQCLLYCQVVLWWLWKCKHKNSAPIREKSGDQFLRLCCTSRGAGSTTTVSINFIITTKGCDCITLSATSTLHCHYYHGYQTLKLHYVEHLCHHLEKIISTQKCFTDSVWNLGQHRSALI